MFYRHAEGNKVTIFSVHVYDIILTCDNMTKNGAVNYFHRSANKIFGWHQSF